MSTQVPPSEFAGQGLYGEFLELFPYRFGSAVKHGTSGTWRSASTYFYLTDDELLRCIEERPQTFRACSFDGTTRFAVISIAADLLVYHPSIFVRLLRLFSERSLKPVVYRASDAGEIHLYISFTEHASTQAVTQALLKLLAKLTGHQQLTGLKIFPANDPCPLPLQQGFAWLSNNLGVRQSVDDLDPLQAVALFLSDLRENAFDPKLLIDLASAEEPAFHQASGQGQHQSFVDDNADQADMVSAEVDDQSVDSSDTADQPVMSSPDALESASSNSLLVVSPMPDHVEHDQADQPLVISDCFEPEVPSDLRTQPAQSNLLAESRDLADPPPLQQVSPQLLLFPVDQQPQAVPFSRTRSSKRKLKKLERSPPNNTS